MELSPLTRAVSAQAVMEKLHSQEAALAQALANTGALGILAKTYSPDFDCARIVHAMELMQLDLAFVPFFEYVRSEANIADLPSRGESQWVVDEFQSEYITTVIPSLDGWLGEARAKRMRTSRGSKCKASGQE